MGGKFLTRTFHRNKLTCFSYSPRLGNNVSTIRTCQYDAAASNQCDVAKQQLQQMNFPDTTIEYCSICKEDMCNAASVKSVAPLTFALMATGLVFLVDRLKSD